MFLGGVGESPSSPGVAALGTPLPDLSFHCLGLWFIVLGCYVLPICLVFLELLPLVRHLGCVGNMCFVLWAFRIPTPVTHHPTAVTTGVRLGKLGLLLVVAGDLGEVLKESHDVSLGANLAACSTGIVDCSCIK